MIAKCDSKPTAEEWRKQPPPTLGELQEKPTAKHPQGVAVILTMPDGTTKRLCASRPKFLRWRLRYFKQIPRPLIDALIPPGPATQPPKVKPSRSKPRVVREKTPPPKPTTLRDLMRKREVRS